MLQQSLEQLPNKGKSKARAPLTKELNFQELGFQRPDSMILYIYIFILKSYLGSFRVKRRFLGTGI